MNILITLPYTHGRGGIETVVTELLNSQFSIENNVTVLIQDKEYSDWLNEILERVEVVTCIANGHNPLTRMLSYVYQVSRLKKLDYVIDAGIKTLSVLKNVRRLLGLHYKIISWPHFSLTLYQDKLQHFKSADYYWAISSDLKQQLLNLEINKEQIALVYNPVNQVQELMPPSNKDDLMTFIYVGRLVEEQKNLTELFAALGGCDNYQLLIYGDGKDRTLFEEICREKQLNVEFKGWSNNPWKEIKQADYLISTSNYEGFGMSIAEAINRGIPVISSDCPVGPCDLIQDGVNGFLYPLNDEKALHDILMKCINREYQWDQDKIKNSLNHFDKAAYIERVLKSLDDFKND